MTVAVSCNLSDGVILGVDSAVSIPTPTGIAKVYENAEKLFQLGEKRIGVATYGIGGLGARSIGSYLREFQNKNPNDVITKQCSIEEVVIEMHEFFKKVHNEFVIQPIEKVTGRKYQEMPMQLKVTFALGFVIGGYSDGENLSEVWCLVIPESDKPIPKRKKGIFGTDWFASNNPIYRYIKGYDPILLEQLKNFFEQNICKRALIDTEKQEIMGIINRNEYPIPYMAMPIQEGIAHTKFLVDLVIGHHRFAVGAPIVGGKAKIGVVTYKGEKFKILKEEDYENYSY